ncbi:MAG: Atg14 domain-containing protein [Alphaproteobacteria bacterium]|nr:Atg14 domain-containing protein [Alphaproteobacteria bacterium]
MKKIMLTFVFVLLSSNSFAQTKSSDAVAKLDAKQTAVENKLSAKKEMTLEQIDAKIAQAKEAGLPTDKLEQKRQEVLDRIAAKEKNLNDRIAAQKAKIEAKKMAR